MRRIIILFAFISSLLIVFSFFPSVVSGSNTNNKIKSSLTKILSRQIDEEELNKIIEELNENDSENKWYPGFLIVQLIKGIAAFILVILILLDIIDPEPEE